MERQDVPMLNRKNLRPAALSTGYDLQGIGMAFGVIWHTSILGKTN